MARFPLISLVVALTVFAASLAIVWVCQHRVGDSGALGLPTVLWVWLGGAVVVTVTTVVEGTALRRRLPSEQGREDTR
ncbi:hypothetical protein LCGC14_1698300 [marine sediment metagenome]|uniref:Uncharacterized protein n=1 Tax=marine sediment metagenome TaxID=412755 RepID=A0A0F9KIQ8_9ZZZZ